MACKTLYTGDKYKTERNHSMRKFQSICTLMSVSGDQLQGLMDKFSEFTFNSSESTLHTSGAESGHQNKKSFIVIPFDKRTKRLLIPSNMLGSQKASKHKPKSLFQVLQSKDRECFLSESNLSHHTKCSSKKLELSREKHRLYPQKVKMFSASDNEHKKNHIKEALTTIRFDSGKDIENFNVKREPKNIRASMLGSSTSVVPSHKGRRSHFTASKRREIPVTINKNTVFSSECLSKRRISVHKCRNKEGKLPYSSLKELKSCYRIDNFSAKAQDKRVLSQTRCDDNSQRQEIRLLREQKRIKPSIRIPKDTRASIKRALLSRVKYKTHGVDKHNIQRFCNGQKNTKKFTVHSKVFPLKEYNTPCTKEVELDHADLRRSVHSSKEWRQSQPVRKKRSQGVLSQDSRHQEGNLSKSKRYFIPHTTEICEDRCSYKSQKRFRRLNSKARRSQHNSSANQNTFDETTQIDGRTSRRSENTSKSPSSEGGSSCNITNSVSSFTEILPAAPSKTTIQRGESGEQIQDQMAQGENSNTSKVTINQFGCKPRANQKVNLTCSDKERKFEMADAVTEHIKSAQQKLLHHSKRTCSRSGHVITTNSEGNTKPEQTLQPHIIGSSGISLDPCLFAKKKKGTSDKKEAERNAPEKVDSNVKSGKPIQKVQPQSSENKTPALQQTNKAKRSTSSTLAKNKIKTVTRKESSEVKSVVGDGRCGKKWPRKFKTKPASSMKNIRGHKDGQPLKSKSINRVKDNCVASKKHWQETILNPLNDKNADKLLAVAQWLETIHSSKSILSIKRFSFSATQQQSKEVKTSFTKTDVHVISNVSKEAQFCGGVQPKSSSNYVHLLPDVEENRREMPSPLTLKKSPHPNKSPSPKNSLLEKLKVLPENSILKDPEVSNLNTPRQKVRRSTLTFSGACSSSKSSKIIRQSVIAILKEKTTTTQHRIFPRFLVFSMFSIGILIYFVSLSWHTISKESKLPRSNSS